MKDDLYNAAIWRINTSSSFMGASLEFRVAVEGESVEMVKSLLVEKIGGRIVDSKENSGWTQIKIIKP